MSKGAGCPQSDKQAHLTIRTDLQGPLALKRVFVGVQMRWLWSLEMRKINRKLLILAVILPVGCLAGLVFGLIMGWQFLPVKYVNTEIGNFGPTQAEEYVLVVATEFSTDDDVDRARQRLAELDVPNPEQFVAYLADKYVQEDRGPEDADTVNLVRLSEALGVGTISMVVYIATPTPLPTVTFTPLPTATPTHTPTLLPTDTPTPLPTDTPAATPTDTPVAATDTPTPGPPTPTFTPAPPTATPTPTTPPVDFVISNLHMFTIQENGGCMGNHNVFISVVDVNGAPLLGAVIADPPWNNFRLVTGEKNEPVFNFGTKLTEIELTKSSTQVQVVEYPAGNPVSSEQTPTLSTNDWEIPLPWLVEAGYCASEAECTARRADPNRVGNNTLCWGHYSYWVQFQATHPF